MKLYLANGLFGIADRNFNDTLAAKIREEIPELEVYLPQENVVVNDKKQVQQVHKSPMLIQNTSYQVIF